MMDQKDYSGKALGYVQGRRYHRWWRWAVAGMAAAVIVLTAYLLILPAITMERDMMQVTASPSNAVLGETIFTEICAEAVDDWDETVFLLKADGDNAGADEDLLDFDDENIAVIQDEDGQEIELHREYQKDGTVDYWFVLTPGQSSRFYFPWINGVSRYRTETEAETSKPEITESEATEPEITEPEITEPEITDPEVTEPEVTEPEVTEPETAEPESTEEQSSAETLETTEDETAESETTKGETVESETTKDETAEDETTEGETEEPGKTESEAPEDNTEKVEKESETSRNDQLSVSRHHAPTVRMSQVIATDSDAEKETEEAEQEDEEEAPYPDLALVEEGDPEQTGTLTLSYGIGTNEKKARKAAKRQSGKITLRWITEEEFNSRPDMVFTVEIGDVTVTATAPYGTLPEGAVLQVTPLNQTEIELLDSYQDAVSAYVYDISFLDEQGQTVEPDGEVSVVMDFHRPLEGAEGEAGQDDSSWELLHFSDEMEPENLSQNHAAQIQTNDNNEVEKVEFQSDAFSVYVLVETREERGKENIQINGITYIAVPNASVSVDGQTDSEVSGVVGQLFQVDILFELGTTGDSRKYFYYELPVGIQIPESSGGIVYGDSGEAYGTYSYEMVGNKLYLLLDITKHSTNMSGWAYLGVKFEKEGSYKFEGGPTINIFPGDIDKGALQLSKTASDAKQNADGSWSWMFTIKVTNISEKDMTGIVLDDTMDIVDQGIYLRVVPGTVESDKGGKPENFGNAVTLPDRRIYITTKPMDIPAGTTYTYTYYATLSKEGVEQAKQQNLALSYDNTASLKTKDGQLIREVSAQIAYVTAAEVFQKEGNLSDGDDPHVEWTIRLSVSGLIDASGCPIWDKLNQNAYASGDLDYIKDNSGAFQPYVEVYVNGMNAGAQKLTWKEVDSLQDVSGFSDSSTIYYCQNVFYWPGMTSPEGVSAKYGFELHYWTTYPEDASSNGQSMNQAQSNFKGIPLGSDGTVYHAETVLNKELVSYRNDQKADWKIVLENSATERHLEASIHDELPNQNNGSRPKDTMEKLDSYPDAHPDFLETGRKNYFWIFKSVEEMEEATGIRITAAGSDGLLIDPNELLCHSPDGGSTPAYLGFGYYDWGAWVVYPNLYGRNEAGKKGLAWAAETQEIVSAARWYGNETLQFTGIDRGECSSYLPSSMVEGSDFPHLEGYRIQLEYTTDCAQDAALLQSRRTNSVYYFGTLKELGTKVELSADASYYMTASMELQPVQKSLGEVEMLEDGSMKLTYLTLVDNRYRNSMTTTDQWIDQISGVDGAYYVADSLNMYRAEVSFDENSGRWLLKHVSSLSQLEESRSVDWKNTKYPGFLQVEQEQDGFSLTLDYKNAAKLYEDDPEFPGYAADFKDPQQPNILDAVKGSFYLSYDVIVPKETLSQLEDQAVLRNTIEAYVGGESVGSAYADYALDAMELSKTITDAPIYDNEYMASFRLNVIMTEELKKLRQFSIVDTLSDTLSLDVKSIQVFGVTADGQEIGLGEDYQAYIDGQTLTLLMKRTGDTWAYDRYKITYKAKVNGMAGDKVSFKNSAVISELGGTPQVSEGNVVISQAGAVVEQAQVEIYKYDGDNTKIPLEGAEFALVPLKEEVQRYIIQQISAQGSTSKEEFQEGLDQLGEENWDEDYGFYGETDAAGSLVFTASEDNAVYANRIYCLKEQKSPDGYLLLDGGYRTYFMIYQSSSDPDGTVKKYLFPYVPQKGLMIQYQIPNYKGGFYVYKVSASDHEEYLAGAEFTLFSDETCTQEVSKGVLKEDGKGTLCYYFGGLPAGETFYLKETRAPDGFIQKDEVYQVVITDEGYAEFFLDHQKVEGESLTIENELDFWLPETGGRGGRPFTSAGIFLLGMTFLAVLYRRRRESVPEEK